MQGLAEYKSNTVRTGFFKKMELTTLGGGCFWCTEAVFNLIRGVKKVESGYSEVHSKIRPMNTSPVHAMQYFCIR